MDAFNLLENLIKAGRNLADAVRIAGKVYENEKVVLQTVYTETGTLDSSTTQIPIDNTIPQQSTEGKLVLSLAITPKKADSSLIIESGLLLQSNTTGRYKIAALFRDSTEDAIAAVYASEDITTPLPGGSVLMLTKKVPSNAAVETTFKIHIGLQSTGTLYLNGNYTGVQVFGGVETSWLKITEIS